MDSVSTFANHATFASSSVDASSNGISRLAISGTLPAMPCRSPTIPTVESTAARICASRQPLLAHKLPLPVEVFEFFDHGFDALAEFRAGQILVQLGRPTRLMEWSSRNDVSSMSALPLEADK